MCRPRAGRNRRDGAVSVARIHQPGRSLTGQERDYFAGSNRMPQSPGYGSRWSNWPARIGAGMPWGNASHAGGSVSGRLSPPPRLSYTKRKRQRRQRSGVWVSSSIPEAPTPFQLHMHCTSACAVPGKTPRRRTPSQGEIGASLRPRWSGTGAGRISRGSMIPDAREMVDRPRRGVRTAPGRRRPGGPQSPAGSLQGLRAPRRAKGWTLEIQYRRPEVILAAGGNILGPQLVAGARC